MTALVPWRALDGHEGMAGTARYSAELRLGRRIPEHAVLDLGRIEGTASVNVNGGAAIPVNPFTASVAIPALLRKGVNLIEVTVASPLNNRLLAEGIEDQGFKLPGDAKDVPPSPPPPMKQVDPDLADGPAGMTGMQPGAEPPGSKRVYRDYGLLGPVLLRF